MYLVQLSDTQAHAVADAPIFGSGSTVTSAGYLAAGLQPSQIVNWNFKTAVPTLGEWAFGCMAALLGLGSLGAFRRSANRPLEVARCG